MDRIEFSQSIDNATAEDIINRFEEIMALYDIIHNYEIIKISKNQDDIASFTIELEQDDISRIISALSNLSLVIYNTPLQICCKAITTKLLYISLQRDMRL